MKGVVGRVLFHASPSRAGKGRGSMNGRKVTFVHCGDLHLDSPFSGLADISPALGKVLHKSTFTAFENAVNLALADEADFFLVAGDVFDGEDRSVRAQVFFLDQLRRLSEAGIPSFIAAGNHDPLSGWEADRDFPPLAHRFGPEVESLPLTIKDETIGTIHGYSYPVRDVKDNIALRFGGRRGPGLNVALLHCTVGGRKGHENYAPCSLDDLRGAGMDYWALGHVHAAEVVSRDPLVVYPGNIQGRNIREGGKKGAFMVTMILEDGRAEGREEFVPCDTVRWRSEKLSIEGMDRDEQFFQALEELKEGVRSEGDGRPTLLRLTVTGRGKTYYLLRRPGFLKGPGGLLETVNEGEECRADFVFIEDVVEASAPPLDLDTLAGGAHFTGDFLREAKAFKEGGDLRRGLREILRHRGVEGKISSPEVMRAIEAFTDEDVEAFLYRGVYDALSGLLEGTEGP